MTRQASLGGSKSSGVPICITIKALTIELFFWARYGAWDLTNSERPRAVKKKLLL